jgi:hypothetical protein
MLVGQAAGDELEREADQVNLLTELRDIFGVSTQKMTLAGVGAALADRFPACTTS